MTEDNNHAVVFKCLCSREDVETLLGMRIRTLSFYQEALLHKSAVKVYNAPKSNERLEFIGDSVLNFVIAKYLYEKYPDEDEGFMTKLRTRIVSGKCLSRLARIMGIQDYVRMNEKAIRQGWNHNPRILEDVFEALIGAIFLDMGMYYAKEFILNQLETNIHEDDILTDTNYKDMLMRYTQTKGIDLPVYIVNNENGPNHNKNFIVRVMLNGNVFGEGIAKNKKQSEQNAAKNALYCIGELSV
jgi:ribonuclease-3